MKYRSRNTHRSTAHNTGCSLTLQRNSSTRKALRTLFSTLSFGTLAALSVAAHADTYHAVEPGETLSAISKRYGVKPDALREANKLSNLGDNSKLAAMLLRIPGGEDPTATPARSASTLRAAKPKLSTGRYFGTVTRNVTYTVRDGDTLGSLAASFSKDGHSTSTSEIRAKNNLSDKLHPGSTLLIPVKTTYGSPAAATTSQAVAQVQPPAARAIVPASSGASGDSGDIGVAVQPRTVPGVAVSKEVDLPFARVVSADTPSYQAPNAKKSGSRGQLSARGGYGSMVDGARVLQNGEELLTAPSPRVRATSLPKTHNLAKVAKVATSGARIRRLPEASAVTLYNCSVGTEIAVIKQKGAWSAILMSDRSTGWLPTRYLKFTGVNVDIASQVETTDQSRTADAYTGWKAGYQSNHPAIRYALQWLGTPYRYGGESTRGIDCSSLMQKAFAASGKRLPRVSRDQAKVGTPIDPKNLQPGDRLYFSASGTHVDHTGLYMGNGLYVHASGGARKVVVSRLAEPRSWNIFVGARR